MYIYKWGSHTIIVFVAVFEGGLTGTKDDMFCSVYISFNIMKMSMKIVYFRKS